MGHKSPLQKTGDVISTTIGFIFLLFIALWGVGEIFGAGSSNNNDPLSEREVSGTEQARYDAKYDELNEQDYYSRQGYEYYMDDYAEWSNERRGQSGSSSDPSSIDCDDFSTQDEAQTFFIENGGATYDSYVLDEDSDGVACEWNP